MSQNIARTSNILEANAVLLNIYDQTTIENIHFERSFYEEKFPKKITYYYGILTCIMQFILLILGICFLSITPHISNETFLFIMMLIELKLSIFWAYLAISSRLILKFTKILYNLFNNVYF